MEELYGDFDQESYDPVLNHNEDSVDIYSGLENSPTDDGDRGKGGTFLSPQRLKESMDLYEELVTEEEEQKQTTYNELKTKFDAAQKQVQELLAKLQHVETQNSNLHKENTSLKKNICALIKTAKMEIVRKDEEINKLSNRYRRGSFQPSRNERSEEGCLRNKASTDHVLNSTADSVRKSLDHKTNRGLALQQKDESRLSSQLVCRETAKDPALSGAAVPQSSKNNQNTSLASRNTQSHKHVSSERMTVNSERESSERKILASQSSSSARERACNDKELRPVAGEKQLEKQSCSRQDKDQSSKEKVASEKFHCSVDGEQRESVKITSSKSQSLSHEDPVAIRRSGRSKSPSPQPHEPRGQKSRGIPGEMQIQSRNRGEVVSEMKNSEKLEKQGSTERHRKEERRQTEADGSERRRTRSDGRKEHDHEQKKAKESEGRSRQEGSSSRRNTRPETSKDHHRRSAKDSEGSVRRGASDTIKNGSCTVGRESGRDDSPSSHDASHARRRNDDKSADKRKNSSRTDEQPSKSKASSSRDRPKGSKSSGVSHKSSDRCRAEKETNVLDKTAKNCILTSADHRLECKVNEIDHIVQAVQANSGANGNVQSQKTSAGSHGKSPVAEDSSPKRKLTFMETLNLTLSPVKKSEEATESVESLSEGAIANSSTEHNASFELGEEFCVIDEINNSQQSVEKLPSNGNKHHSPGTMDPQNNMSITPDSEKQMTDPQEVVKENEQEFSETLNKDKDESATTPFEKTCTDLETQEQDSTTNADELGTSANVFQEPVETSPCATDQTVASEGSLLSQGSEMADTHPVVLANVECEEQDTPVSDKKPDEDRSESFKEKQMLHSHPPPIVQESEVKISRDEVSTSAVSQPCSNFETPVSMEVVSSTVSVDTSCKNKTDAADAEMPVSVEITKDIEDVDLCPAPIEGPQADTLTISSTVQENEKSPEQARSSEPDSTGNEVENDNPPSSFAMPHDEDSMMLTLSRIKVIPEAISPLTSPVRQVKKVQQPQSGKEPHVKSLSKDLSTAASVADKDTKKMDMNKENKRPHSSATSGILTDQEALSSTATEEELEEGEIVSESEEDSALVIQSPPNKNMTPTSSHQASPKTPSLERRSQGTPTITPKRRRQGKNTTTDSKDSPTSNKRRFKTVSAPSKAKISTFAEFMNMLSFIRSELRRKYMKLHKNVTKSAFCCIIEMSLASFTEFVDGVDFQRFCRQESDIKPRLTKIIRSIMSNVSNNGIVNRIFEQRAEDLKQKLWTFVDGQFDFLFKELKVGLKGVSELSKNPSALETKRSSPRINKDQKIGQIQAKGPVSAAEDRPSKKAKVEVVNVPKAKELTSNILVQSLPCRVRGLGSRGKNIKATMEGGAQVSEVQVSNQVPDVSSCEKPLQEIVPPSPETKAYARRLSHNGSVQDFDILTEQQTSSLTFNLVTDSQMGDIFRCLLQGSDLMDASVSLGDNQSWALNTPRKEGQAGESLIGIVTPSKMITPSKLITTWASISPYKFVSPNTKVQMPLNPALLDESCMLEVPSNHLPNLSVPALTTVPPQQPYSILAEDLAVSLTIPSPLKSDGHLSFLNPSSGQPLSAPSSVISAHYSEDALLEGEDATEQDIHLSLDTDNSSRGSSTSGTWEGGDPVAFQYRPDLPIQAEVMERSNDHFILKIRHTSTGPQEDPQLKVPSPVPVVDGTSTVPTVEVSSTVGTATVCHEDKSVYASPDSLSPVSSEPEDISNKEIVAEKATTDTSSDVSEGSNVAVTSENAVEVDKQVVASTAKAFFAPTAKGVVVPSTTEDDASKTKTTCESISRKRKKHRSGSKAKRSRTEKSQDRHEQQRHKKRSKSKDKVEKTPSKKEKKISSPQLSPNSLSAKNVIRKKGEVVVTWTREEDRDILVELKMKGPSSKAFAALATKLKKSPTQIEERFAQLMKLFKKKEKMDT